METVRNLDAIAALAVDHHRASPAAVVAAAVLHGDQVTRGRGVAGRLTFAEDAPIATVRTLFDLASVTKPLTALAAARLERAGVIRRDEHLAAILPELAGTRSADVPLDLFLAHTRRSRRAQADLCAPPRWRIRRSGEGARHRRGRPARRLRGPPAVGRLSSHLQRPRLPARRCGARGLRGKAPLDAILRREVIDLLGLRMGSARQLREREPSFDATVAPTEVVAWRGGTVRGAVHDENAWAIAKDAAAGHAGIFGDAASVLELGLAILGALEGRRLDFLTPAEMAPLVIERPGSSLLAGFDRRSGASPSSGARFGPRTFGHLGFTGTSLWIDPEVRLVGVLLTNRVHPTRATDAIRRARPAVYDALAERMSSVAPSS